MVSDKLMTIAQIGKQLHIPESTVRFYRDRFEPFIPSVGSGRNKRYLPETVAVLQHIADAFKRQEPQEQIEADLARLFPRNIEVTPDTRPVTTIAQQDHTHGTSEQLQQALFQIAGALETMAKQNEEISDLRKHIADLEDQQQKQKIYMEEALNKRDQQLTQTLREIQESKQKKRWFSWKK